VAYDDLSAELNLGKAIRLNLTSGRSKPLTGERMPKCESFRKALRATVAGAACLFGLLPAMMPATAATFARTAGGIEKVQAHTPIAVFGRDDRVVVPSRLQAVAERVGLLFNNRSRTVCTAFCVADNVIATAAHCLARGQTTGPVDYKEFNFARNYERIRDSVRIEGAATGSAAQHILSGDFRLKTRPPIDAAQDWALVRVPRNTCPAQALEVRAISHQELMAESTLGHVFQISYHRDFALWRPAYGGACPVARDYDAAKWSAIAPDFIAAEQMILHTCDTGGASSGSPLLLETKGGPVVVGINVGTYVQTRIVTPKAQASGSRQHSETIANTAVNASQFASFIHLLRNAQILSSGAAIRDLQEKLRKQSLYLGRNDGSFGPALKTAIEAYEQARQLPVTGLPTRAILQRLVQDGQRSGQVAPTSSTAPSPRR
jgi:V8-like Glu-specific endopeptidase